MRRDRLSSTGVGRFVAVAVAVGLVAGWLGLALRGGPTSGSLAMATTGVGIGIGLGALLPGLLRGVTAARRRRSLAGRGKSDAGGRRSAADLRRFRAWMCALDAAGGIVESKAVPYRAGGEGDGPAAAGRFIDALPAQDRPRVLRALARLLRGRPVATFKCRLPDGGGPLRWYQCLGLLNAAAAESDARVRLIGIDITEQRNALESLRRSRTLLAETEQLARIGGWELDVETRRGRWTEGLRWIFDVPPDFEPELPRDFRFIEPPHRAALQQALERACSTGAPWELEVEIRTASGERRWVRMLGAAQRHAGRVAALRGTCQDVTELRHAQETLRSSEERFRLIFENSPDAIFWADPQTGILTNCNRAAEALLERPRDEIIGAVHTLLHPPEQHAHYARLFRQQADALDDVDCDAEIVTRSGTVRPVHITSSCTTVGATAIVQGMFRDITERVRAEEQLRESHAMMVEALQREKLAAMQLEATMEQYLAARDDAEAAARAKTEFLANMSHEIRTPMTAILGFAENLLDPELSPTERSEMIGTIQRNGSYLLEILNDILDLSRIEAGKLHIERVAVSPAALAREVRQLMQVRADSKGLALELDIASGVPEWIESDPTRIKQVLVNLVGNAIKFTDVGTVALALRCVRPGPLESPHAGPRLEFAIHDTGIGMSAAEVAGLFQPFVQADTTTTRRYGGTGLGLTISKRLAEMLGGDLLVESAPGQGSVLRLLVPAAPARPSPPAAKTTAPAEAPASRCAGPRESAVLNARVLLAEDGPDNQRLISFLLRRAGATVDLAANGEEAVQAALAAKEHGQPYDIVLMDMQMPVMDGYDATRALRRQGYRHPIVAVTAHAMVIDRQKCLDAGCDDYLSKPIDRPSLIRVVRAAARKSGRRPTLESLSPEPLNP